MAGRRRRVGILVTFTLSVAVRAFAQTAPPPAPTPPPPPPAHEGSAEFALVATNGNTSTRTLGLRGDITFRPGKWVYLAKAAYVQNEVEDVLAARSFATSFRASREVSKVVSLFGQVAYLHDRFSGIDHRSAVEAGVAWKWEGPRQSFGADVGAGYANEQRIVPPNLSTGVGTSGFKYKLKISETSDFTDELRYTQSFSVAADYRFDQLAALTAKLSTMFSLKLSNNVRFVNAPVAGFQKTDTITSMALVAKF